MDMTTNGKLMMGGMRNQSKPFLLIKKKKKALLHYWENQTKGFFFSVDQHHYQD
jgi:hypothetical protein